MYTSENKAQRRPKKSMSTARITLILLIIAAVSILAASAVLLLPSILKASEPNNEPISEPMTEPLSSPLTSPSLGDTAKEDIAQPPTVGLLDPATEVRGIYIASVLNINYPSKQGISAEELRSELDDIIATCLDANLNTIYFQVRPASDALYASKIFPVSKYLTGTQGSPLPDGFDPLAYLVDEAHENGLFVHAWVNPLRVTVGSASAPEHDVTALAEGHPARQNPEYVIAYADGRLYYDCGLPEVRALIASGVTELTKNYAIDGIIFDDYFYPYPTYGSDGKLAAFDDAASFKQYGDGMTLADWRRDNVNRMIEDCYNAIKEVDPECLFGVAPFGIWQNDDGTNGGSETSGLEAYESIYCDPIAWAQGGYVDYLAPQIYWRFSTSVARYDVLVRWWNTMLDGTDVDLLISHGIYNYETWEDPENELRNQIVFARSELQYRGSILYGYAALKQNLKGLLTETREVFKDEIIYTDIVSNERDLIISIPYSGSYIDGEGTFVIGTSDPTEPLYLDGAPIGRTKSGYFSVYLPLNKGKNTFTFEHKDETLDYVIHRGTQSITQGAITYAKLNSPEIAAVTPSYEWFGSGQLPVSVTAPKGSTVTAELDGKKITLVPTLYAPNQGGYMKEVYTGSFLLSANSGEIRDLGKIQFKSVFGGETYTAESARIRVRGAGAAIPIEVLSDDTELKIQPDSWYYDDYTPQSEGMHDNAVSLSSGLYKLRCGGYISAERVKETGGAPLGIAKLESAVITSDADATYLKIKASENLPLNCYIENGEFCVTIYNMDTASAPSLEMNDNPLFISARGVKSTKANAYKYFLNLVAVENFYGFDHYYEDGYIVVKFTNPQVLPDTETPLSGKTIILDAGHGGANPGALGPLGAADGAMNESDFNLEIVLAAEEYLKKLGANVILIRDRDCEIDVPIADRMQTLIDVQPDLMISIHQNSMPYTSDITKIRGLVGLYWADSGYMLTDVMGEVMSDALGKLDRSPTKQRLAMVRNPKFPATLIETCFITSVEEYEVMMQPHAIDTIARSVADGVLAYYENQRQYLD